MSHTARASATSSRLQQVFDPAAPTTSLVTRRMVAPTTSWPASISSLAATLESTPPLMATSTRLMPSPSPEDAAPM